MSEWQPINTAPKDGTDILVFGGDSDDPQWGVAAFFDADAARLVEREPGWAMWNDPLGRVATWPQWWKPLDIPEAAALERAGL